MNTAQICTPRAITDDAAAAWRLLRDEGGWWTVGEIGRRVRPDVLSPSASGTRWMLALLARNHVWMNTARSVRRYGVTRRCIPLPGEVLEPQLTGENP